MERSMKDYSVSATGVKRHPAIADVFRREAEEFEAFSKLDLSKVDADNLSEHPQLIYDNNAIVKQSSLPYLMAAAQMHADEKLIGEGKEPRYPGKHLFYVELAYGIPWPTDTDRWRACWGSDWQISSDVFHEFSHVHAGELLARTFQPLINLRIQITERQKQLGVKNQEQMKIGWLFDHAWYSYTKALGPDRVEPQTSWPKIRKVRYPVDYRPSHAWEVVDGNEARKLLQLLSDVVNHVMIDLVRSRRKGLNLSADDIEILYQNIGELGRWAKYLYDLDIPNLTDEAALALTQTSHRRLGFGPAGALSKNGGQLTPDRVHPIADR